MSAPTSAGTTTKVAAQTPSAVLRYLRRNPFAVALSAAVVLLGLILGTLWGEFPEDLAAGPLTTGQLAYWWTPVTAMLIPDSAIDAVLSVGLALTVMAYAERLLGTVRTMLVFLLVGAGGLLAGVGLEALGAAWGESWGQMSQLDLVLDPSIGVVAVIVTASALAPALFRRRIRVIGLTVLVMFALYAGDSDSVYRLLAALLGFGVGLMLSRNAATGVLLRSSFRETRALVAAVVAAVGLGPVIVLLSGTSQGPLSLVVAGFASIDPDEVFTRCATDLSARCDADIAVALTVGAGPFLLSLMPLALSLVAAWGLRTGRRASWVLALAVNGAIALLTAISLGGTQLLDAAMADIVGPEFVIWSVAAILVPIAVGAMLLVTARRFQVRAPRSAALRFLLTTGGTFIVLAVAYVAIAFVRGADFLTAPTAADVLTDTLRAFVPFGFLTGVPMTAIPIEGLALIGFQWVGVIFWIVFILALLLLYRANASGATVTDQAQFRALLKEGGGGTLGFMGTWPGNDYWFTPGRTAAVAYRVINGVALTMSDPVAPQGDTESVIRGFVDYCDSQGWTAVFYSFHDRYLPIFQSFGWQHMSVGEETVLALPSLDMAGKPWQKIRQALNKGSRAGITTLWSTWDDLPAPVAAQINAISEQWIAEKELPEMGFTLGGVAELKDPDVYLYLAINPEGGLEAITSWLPSWTDGRVTGWTIDFMRRGDDSMPGIMEFVIASAALHMKEHGAEVMSLSGAPLATKPDNEQPAEPNVMDALLAWLGNVLEPAYGFTSLFRFKSKFNPNYETIHMAYADRANLPAIGLAISKAYLPEVSPREYVALAKTLTRHGRH